MVKAKITTTLWVQISSSTSHRYFILDFYCSEARLAIEIDGGQHSDDQHRKRDCLRTSVIKEEGIQVIRFWNDDVLKHLDDVIAEIDATLNEIMTKKKCDN